MSNKYEDVKGNEKIMTLLYFLPFSIICIICILFSKVEGDHNGHLSA